MDSANIRLHLIWETFMKICREYTDFIEIAQIYGTLDVKT